VKDSSSIETTPTLPRRKSYRAEPTATLRRLRADRDRAALESILAEAADLLETLLRGPWDADSKKRVGLSALQLVDRAKTNVGSDGYGNHTPGAEPPEGKPRDVLDRDGNVKPTDKEPAYEVSDPTGDAAMASLGGYDNPDRLAAARVARHITKGLDELRSAVNELVKTQPADNDKPAAGEPCCASHARLKSFEHIYPKAPNSGLCRFCYEHWLVHAAWPNLALLGAKIQGRKITTAVLREAGYKA
jgi:hypothetical protein